LVKFSIVIFPEEWNQENEAGEEKEEAPKHGPKRTDTRYDETNR